VSDEWTDAEIRGLMERITMERRRADRKARTERKQPRPLIPRRAVRRDVRRPAGMVTKKKKAG
jgi:hypothetical protein